MLTADYGRRLVPARLALRCAQVDQSALVRFLFKAGAFYLIARYTLCFSLALMLFSSGLPKPQTDLFLCVY